MPQPPATAKFHKLINDITRIYERAHQAQVKFALEIGARIVEVEQDGDIRAQYGSQLIPKVSVRLTKKYGPGFSVRNLINMRRFYLDSKITQPAAKLTWSNHVELLRIRNPKMRAALEKRVVKEALTKEKVRKVVSKVISGFQQTTAKNLPALKPPTDLKLNTFCRSKLTAKIRKGHVLIDCGFFFSWPVTTKRAAKLNLTDTPSYTYAATIDRVIDGDTLVVLIDVGFNAIIFDKLRLRAVGCAELKTPEGERAKRYVAGLLPPGSAIVIKSNKSRTDQHGRFVVDVFFKTGVNRSEAIIRDGVYLNQHLIDQGLAVRMKE